MKRRDNGRDGEEKGKLCSPGIGCLQAALTILGLTIAMGSPTPSLKTRDGKGRGRKGITEGMGRRRESYAHLE